MNTGTKPVASRNNLLTTVAWRIGGRTEYALEGSVFIAGAVVQWLRDGLWVIRSSGEVESLAAQVIAKGGHVIDTRGEAYSRENIGERLAMRDFMDGLRASGVDTGGPSALSARDVQNFANQLDRFLARHAGKP
jgi:hypothetical protein